MNDFHRLFPATGKSSCQWIPIFLEPIAQSGERLNIAIAAHNGRDYLVARTIPETKIQCFYGTNSNKINDLIQLTIESLENCLEISKDFDSLELPFEGLHLGTERSINIDDLEKTINVAISFTSSIGMLINNKPELLDTNQSRIVNKRWLAQVRTALIEKNSNFDKFFNISFPVQDKKTIKYDFVHNSYASNLGYIDSKRISISKINIEAKLLHLEILKKSNNDLLIKPNTFELILGVPNYDDPTISPSNIVRIMNSIDILKKYSHDNGINMVTVNNAEDAANHIYQQVS